MIGLDGPATSPFFIPQNTKIQIHTMKLSVLIKKLQDIKAKHGDIETRVQSLSHTWSPEPELRPNAENPTHVLLNP